MLKIGLTGGIGTGKSEALKAFAAAGARVLSLDMIARALSRKGAPAYRGVAREFPQALGPDGEIDRRSLGKLVFARPRLRRRLEALTHPLILRAMRRKLRALRTAAGRAGAGIRGRVAVVDVPLLFEAGVASEFDAVVLVTASRRAQLRRVMARDGLSRASALRRMRAQWPLGRKRRLADVVIANDGSLEDLRRAVKEYQRAFELIASKQQ